MPEYAKNTTVSADKTLTEISAIIRKYKASAFGYAEQNGKVGVTFEMQSRRVRFVVPLPERKDYQYVQINAHSRRQRTETQWTNAYEQAVRQRWRALLLTIKAKLESVESGIETFEEAFQAQLVLPDGRTVGDWLAPQIEAAYATGDMPPLLVSGGR